MNFKNIFRPGNRKRIKDKIDMDTVKNGSIPKHVAIIMDGNGRWATNRGLPRTAGHRQGVETIRDIIETSAKLGIEHITLYAFSTENWKRPEKEIQAIMGLLVEYIRRELDNLHKNNVKLVTIGDITVLPDKIRKKVIAAESKTGSNTGLQVNVAFNYGGRLELVTAFKGISKKIINNELSIEDINEELISEHLFTRNIPDPDLLIRTGGDQRISNFLLYQIAYTELWFTDAKTFWPDFDQNRYLEAISEFQNRQRRYGDIEKRED